VKCYFRKRIVATLLSCAFLSAQSKGPERKVLGNVITSEHHPRVRIELPASVQYVGADRWVLYGIADCELHAFVDADQTKNVQRLYWVQFEGYLPTRPELEHTYDSPRMARLGGMEFYVDTWVRPANATERPGSDVERIRALIQAGGYKLPAAMMSVRLVHLLDEQKRKELMIVYSEDLAPTGFTASDLLQGGKAYGRWPSLQNDLVERAEKKFSFENTQKQ
jgi:hypothetical protein